MVSKTRMLEHIKHLRWREVEAALKENPALLAVRDERGRNWLHVCCGLPVSGRGFNSAHSIKTVDVLLRAGVDLDQEAFREGEWRATPLWYAISRGRNLPLARHLLGRGSNPNHCLWSAAFHDDVDAIKLLLAADAELEPVVEDETPFLGAVKYSHFRAAKALLDAGANPDFQDSRGMTALHYMLKKGSDARHLRMVVDHGARGDVPNRDGVTALQILSRKRGPGFRELAAKLARHRPAR